MIEYITFEDSVLAIILKAKYSSDGIKFFTPNEYSQQLGYMNRPLGYSIDPHIHNSVPREVQYTKEVLLIKSGKVRVDFYSEKKLYCFSKILFTGDIILLSMGGHGFYMLEQSEIIEVKQGPYAGDHDKTHFTPALESEINIIP